MPIHPNNARSSTDLIPESAPEPATKKALEFATFGVPFHLLNFRFIFKTMHAAHPLVHPVTLTLPKLPASLQGLRIVHLTDLHITRPTRRHKLLVKLLNAINADLILLTGDYMTHPGHEDASEKVMRELASHFKARLGTYGVYGNHDTMDLRTRLHDLPGVTWLNNQTHPLPDLPLEIVGMETLKYVYPDSVAMLGHQTKHASNDAINAANAINANHDTNDTEPAAQAVPVQQSADVKDLPLRIMLCHHPTYLPVASDLGVDLMLSGHTHGGQCRLPFKRAILNSTDLPMHLTSGVLRHRDTLGLVSRGLGEVHLPLRVFCPPQLPVYELKRGPLVGEHSSHMVNHQAW